ncbi:MAG: hypothetical protein RLZZ494_451 [Pseudomonadota bacterium]|jgi:uncharacterized membrane protein SpoIIM required for sporulation
MMSALAFEAQYRPQWEQLRQALAGGANAGTGLTLVQTYRSTCEHLALARSRHYPLRLVQELEQLTALAHQHVYRPPAMQPLWALRRWWRAVPEALRAQRGALWVSLASFALPLLAMLALTWWEPSWVLSVLSASQAHMFEQMYGPDVQDFGRLRDAGDDWTMFGYYILHNIGIGFQCFAGGLLLGLGSLFYLVLNGVILGAVAGYLTHQGLGQAFWGFVVGHAPFELSAVVLAGAAGLRLGQALLMPGRLRRSQALIEAGHAVTPLVWAVMVLLVGAAWLEAFWSSIVWMPMSIKLSVSAVGWALVLTWFSGWTWRGAGDGR